MADRNILDELRDPRFIGQEGMRERAADEIERLERAVATWKEQADMLMQMQQKSCQPRKAR